MSNFSILRVGIQFFVPFANHPNTDDVRYVEMKSTGEIVSERVFTTTEIFELSKKIREAVYEYDNIFSALKDHYNTSINPLFVK